MDNPEKLATQGTQHYYKCQRIQKGQSQMDNPEKLSTQGSPDEEKQNKDTIWVRLHYAQANTNKVNRY